MVKWFKRRGGSNSKKYITLKEFIETLRYTVAIDILFNQTGKSKQVNIMSTKSVATSRQSNRYAILL